MFFVGLPLVDKSGSVAYTLQIPTIKRTDEFSNWLRDLRDIRARAKVISRIERLSLGNPGDVAPVGDGISELRIHYGPEYRFTTFSAVRRSSFCFVAETRVRRLRISGRPRSWRGSWRTDMAKAKPFDAAEYLDSPEMIAAYINEALESEDASAIAVAIGTVARARGMSAVAEEAGLLARRIFIGRWAEKRSRNSPRSSRCFMRSASIWLPGRRARGRRSRSLVRRGARALLHGSKRMKASSWPRACRVRSCLGDFGLAISNAERALVGEQRRCAACVQEDDILKRVAGGLVFRVGASSRPW